MKNWIFNQYWFIDKPIIVGYQWIIAAIIEKIAPIDKT